MSDRVIAAIIAKKKRCVTKTGTNIASDLFYFGIEVFTMRKFLILSFFSVLLVFSQGKKDENSSESLISAKSLEHRDRNVIITGGTFSGSYRIGGGVKQRQDEHNAKTAEAVKNEEFMRAHVTTPSESCFSEYQDNSQFMNHHENTNREQINE